MTGLRVLLARLAGMLTGRRRDAELEAEVEAHLDLLAADHERRGLSPDAAREAARREFGGVERMKETYHDQRGWRWVGDLGQDVWYAARTLRRAPGFTAVAVLTLALGIGANTAIFSVVNAVLLKPLPYPGAEGLVRLMMSLPAAASPSGAPLRTAVALSADDVASISARTRTLSHIGIAGPELVGLSGYEDAARLQGARVSSASLQMLGVQPVLGRLLSPEDDRAGAEPVVLMAQSAWRRYFAGDPGILGRSLTFDSVLGPRRQSRYTVIGVMPDGFDFPRAGSEFWMPLATPAPGGRGVPRGPMLGKLQNGVSIEAAEAELVPVIRAIRKGQRGNDVAEYRLAREHDELVAPVRPALVILSVAVGFVLLIACINVANLLLARASARQPEIAIRTALGAGRGRLVRQALTESVLLGLLGGALGTTLAIGSVRLLRTLATTMSRFDLGTASGFPRLAEVAVDMPVLLLTIGVSVTAGILFGLAPAIRYSDATQAATLRERGRVPMRSTLVVAEVGLAMILLVGSGLLIHSFVKLSAVETGYDATNVLTFQVALPADRYPDDRLKAFAEEMVARVRSFPGIEAAGYANQLPLVQIRDTAGGLWRTPDPNRPPPPPPGPDVRLVSHDYLNAMNVRVVAGRSFGARDAAGQPRVLLINEALARQDFPGQSPIGRLVYIGRDVTPWEIAGIVGDVRQFGLDQEPGPQVFVDMRQWAAGGLVFPTSAYYVVRTAADPVSVVPNLRGLIRELDTQATLFNVAPMEQLVATTISRPRMYAVLLGIFAGVGVLLAVIGIYGVLAYSVAQRTREIGIRMALGAQRAEVLRLVLRQSLVLTGAGVGLGLLGAGLVTRYLERLLFGVTPLDPPTWVAVSVLFVAIALLASYVPARRATRVNPLVALRYE